MHGYAFCGPDRLKPSGWLGKQLEIYAHLCRINRAIADGYRNVPEKHPSDCRAISEVGTLALVVYGCTTLRMTEMPFVEKRPLLSQKNKLY